MGVETVVEVSPTKFELESLLVWMGGWVVDKTKMMQCHLLTEVGVNVEETNMRKMFSEVNCGAGEIKEESQIHIIVRLEMSIFLTGRDKSFTYTYGQYWPGAALH